MKKTVYFFLLTILVAGILSITALAIYQNQISASPWFGGPVGTDLTSDSTAASISTVNEMTQYAEQVGTDNPASTADEMTQYAEQVGTGWVDTATGAISGAGGATGGLITGGGGGASGSSGGASGGVLNILPSQPSNLVGVQDIGTIIQRIIQVLFYGAQIIFIIILLYGGIQYLTSMGEEAKMGAARKIIFAALIGIVIVFSVWAIAQFVINALT